MQTAARLGGYSGPGNNKINILDGIKQRAGNNIKVLYAEGAEYLVMSGQSFLQNI